MKRDYYEILNVQRNASSNEIKKSFRKLAQTCHPDKNQGDPKSEEQFKELNEAYEVLMDPDKRAGYDRYGHNQPQGGGGGFNPFEHFNGMGFNPFGDFFNGDIFGGRGNRQQGVQRGEDLQCVVEIGLEEVFTGCVREINFSKHVVCEGCEGKGSERNSSTITCSTCGGHGRVNVAHGPFHVTQTCPACRGSGQYIKDLCKSCNGEGRKPGNHRVRITIPIGIEDGTGLRVSGNGSAGKRNGQPGDLICAIKIREHNFFKRDGLDLHCKVNIPFVLAALGGDVPIQGLDKNYTVTVPPGTQSEDTLRIPEGGLISHSSRGSIYVQVKVTVPQTLTDEQKQALLVYANL